MARIALDSRRLILHLTTQFPYAIFHSHRVAQKIYLYLLALENVDSFVSMDYFIDFYATSRVLCFSSRNVGLLEVSLKKTLKVIAV